MNLERLKLVLLFVLLLSVDGLIASNDSTNYKRPFGQWVKTWKFHQHDTGSALVLNPIRSYLSVHADLDLEREFLVWDDIEGSLYRDLAKSSISPGFFLLEFTAYPTSIISAWTERDNPQLYHQFKISDTFNILRSAGLGRLEPWSGSIFLGQIGTFWALDEDYNMRIAATGASGMVLTGGNVQIVDNGIIKSNWARLEWKIKGHNQFHDQKGEWDIKIGHRWYGIDDIPNTVSVIFFRSRTDRSKVDWSLSGNSLFKFEVHVPSSFQSDIARLLMFYGKVFPVKKRLLGIKLGFSYENRRPYNVNSGLFESEKKHIWQLFIQPIVKF